MTPDAEQFEEIEMPRNLYSVQSAHSNFIAKYRPFHAETADFDDQSKIEKLMKNCCNNPLLPIGPPSPATLPTAMTTTKTMSMVSRTTTGAPSLKPTIQSITTRGSTKVPANGNVPVRGLVRLPPVTNKINFCSCRSATPDSGWVRGFLDREPVPFRRVGLQGFGVGLRSEPRAYLPAESLPAGREKLRSYQAGR